MALLTNLTPEEIYTKPQEENIYKLDTRVQNANQTELIRENDVYKNYINNWQK